MNDYLQGLVCQLAGPYCNDIRVYVERNPVFNASMYPNGMMNIYTGFLLRTQNEAQVCAVLGHEIGHYIRRHGLQRGADARAKADFMMGFSMVMGAAGIPVVTDIAHLAVMSSMHSFSRDNEREADLIGINIMAQNNYDTREASKIWRQLILEENPDKDAEEISTAAPFASSHPAPAERMNTLEKIANGLQGPDQWGITGKERFDRIVGSWKFRMLEDEVRVRSWKSTLTLLELLEKSGHHRGEIAFFRGEVFRNRNDEGDKDAERDEDKKPDTERAVAAYNASIATGSPPPQTYRALGLLYHRLGKAEEARRNLLAYLDHMPTAKDASMIRYVIGQVTGPTS